MKNEILRKKNIPLRIAGIMLLLVLVFAYSITGLYAKYINSDSGDDTARVAKFEIGDNLAEQVAQVEIRMAPGDAFDVENYIEITNNSEVSVKYTLEVIRETNNLPIVIEEMKTGTIAANAGDETVGLNVSWPEEANDYCYSHEIDLITIKLTAEQID